MPINSSLNKCLWKFDRKLSKIIFLRIYLFQQKYFFLIFTLVDLKPLHCYSESLSFYTNEYSVYVSIKYIVFKMKLMMNDESKMMIVFTSFKNNTFKVKHSYV